MNRNGGLAFQISMDELCDVCPVVIALSRVVSLNPPSQQLSDSCTETRNDDKHILYSSTTSGRSSSWANLTDPRQHP